MAYDLEKMGIIPNKSFKTRFPFEIDPSLYRHVFRGIIDGDGSVQSGIKYTPKDNKNRFYHSISCCGTHRLMSEMLKYIKENLDLRTNITVYDYKNKSLSEFKISLYEDVGIFGRWIYEDSRIFLKRKEEKFNDIVNYYGLNYNRPLFEDSLFGIQ